MLLLYLVPCFSFLFSLSRIEVAFLLLILNGSKEKCLKKRMLLTRYENKAEMKISKLFLHKKRRKESGKCGKQAHFLLATKINKSDIFLKCN